MGRSGPSGADQRNDEAADRAQNGYRHGGFVGQSHIGLSVAGRPEHQQSDGEERNREKESNDACNQADPGAEKEPLHMKDHARGEIDRTLE